MPMPRFTARQVYDVLLEVTEQNATRITPQGQCHYRDVDGSPKCQIGHVLHRLGVLDEVCPRWDERPRAQPLPINLWHENGQPIDAVHHIETYFDDNTLAFLRKVQQEQDGQQPWMRALVAGVIWANRQAITGPWSWTWNQ